MWFCCPPYFLVLSYFLALNFSLLIQASWRGWNFTDTRIIKFCLSSLWFPFKSQSSNIWIWLWIIFGAVNRLNVLNFLLCLLELKCLLQPGWYLMYGAFLRFSNEKKNAKCKNLLSLSGRTSFSVFYTHLFFPLVLSIASFWLIILVHLYVQINMEESWLNCLPYWT